jgi:AcrR family transcriptional regulator
MPKRRQDRAEVSRERILEAATELFSQRGYAGAGVDELAARSAIAKTAIYYHFGNKEGLLAAVLERAATAWIDGIREASRQAGGPVERLDRALLGMRAMLEEKPWILKLLQILALEVAEDKPEIRATLQSILRRARDAFVSGMHEALGTEVPGAEVVAGLILAFLDGISLGLHLAPDEIPLDDAFEEMRRIALFMVASRLRPDLVQLLEQGAAAMWKGDHAPAGKS